VAELENSNVVHQYPEVDDNEALMCIDWPTQAQCWQELYATTGDQAHQANYLYARMMANRQAKEFQAVRWLQGRIRFNP